MFERYLDNLQGKYQVMSVGAGFDSTFFNLADNWLADRGVFYEVDLDDNVRRKTKLIRQSSQCLRLIQDMDESVTDEVHSCNYKLFACDLANQRLLEERLVNLGFDFDLPTVVLSECVITYMEEADSTRLIKWLAGRLAHGSLVVYEQIRPGDGFGSFMVNHFKGIGSPIKGVHRFPTCRDQKDRYLRCGWGRARVCALTDVWLGMPADERARLSRLEPFDEYEEFLLKSAHYAVVCASNGPGDLFDHVPDSREDESAPSTMFWSQQGANFGNVFGHRAVSVGAGWAVVGGFGVDNGQHKRVGAVRHLNANFETVKVYSDKRFERLYCAVETGGGDTVYVCGGRRSPGAGLSDILKLNISTGACAPLGAELPVARWRHTCSLVAGTHLVVVGGVTGAGASDHIWCLNLETRQTTEARLPAGLHSHSAAVWNNKVIVSGGIDPTGVVKAQLVVICVRPGGELTVRTAEVEDLAPRAGHTSHIVAGALLLVGGVGIGDPPGVEVTDLVTGRLVDMVGPPGQDAGVYMLHGHQSVVKGGQIFVLGGGGNCFSFGTHYNRFVLQIDLTKTFPTIDWTNES